MQLGGTLVTIAGIVLVASVLGGAISQMMDVTKEQSSSLEEQLGEYHREITLSTDHHLAREQLTDTTHLITLRSIHCKALVATINSNENNDVSVDDGETEITIPKDLRNATSLEEESVKNLECIGKNSAVKMAGLEFAESPGEWAVNGLLSLVGLGDSELESEDRVDQEGNVGNVKFTYPEDAEAPLTMIAEKNPMKTGEIPGLEPGNSLGLYLWQDEPVYFFPDPVIAEWAANRDEEYYIPGNAPTMKNIPMINNSPISKSVDGERVATFPINEGANRKVNKLSKFLPGDIDTPYYGYEFVICPGTSGRIQSNAGSPDNSGEAFEGAAWKENTAFPFVEIPKSSNISCVEDYELEGDWTPLSSIETAGEGALTAEDYQLDIQLPDESTGRVYISLPDANSDKEIGIFLIPDPEEYERWRVKIKINGNLEYYTPAEPGQKIEFSVMNYGESGGLTIYYQNDEAENDGNDNTDHFWSKELDWSDFELEKVKGEKVEGVPPSEVKLTKIFRQVRLGHGEVEREEIFTENIVREDVEGILEDGVYTFNGDKDKSNTVVWRPEEDFDLGGIIGDISIECSNFNDVRISKAKAEENDIGSDHYSEVSGDDKTYEVRCGLKRMQASAGGETRPFWSVQPFVREVGG